MSGFRAVERSDGIWEFHFQDFKRDTTDDWVQTAMRDNRHYANTGEHLRQIYYIESSVLPTPYASSKAIMLAQKMPPNIHISTAVLVPNHAIVSVARIIVKRVPGTDYMRIFMDEDLAEAWLEQRHQEYVGQLPGQRVEP
ncbi:hypothetical protein G4Y79_03230 [Phototrophicus methaneseepsis]|uniref:STAS/SEC14 domain-containing protein n=1 Tax=Phototrophicus methaneseepsis TaxID=2710758 RepID=A0A7S8EAL9_9CHLR|nr:hypothetical protein [Phototrophicus methaneseepsis]QPC83409.1 hypothetical protein G4Y79_03230 [Phototrophicus methaneseepsis]